MPKLSIITPNFNKGPFLVETILSVQKNTFKDWEMIIIDDGSTDNSMELISGITQEDLRIKVFKQSNLGGGLARNKGIEEARGQYLLFLDSDDLLTEKCLEQRVSVAESHSHAVGWVFPLLPFKGKIEDQIFIQPWIPPRTHFLEKLIEHDITWTSMSPLWDTAFIKRHGRWNPQYPRLQDIEFHTHLLLQDATILTFPDLPADCFYRLDENKLVLGSRYNYLDKWVMGCGLYLDEFIPILPKPLSRKITRTSLACQEVMGHYLRVKQINRKEFDTLSLQLRKSIPYPIHRMILRIYSEILRVSPIHIPGLAKVFKFCLR